MIEKHDSINIFCFNFGIFNFFPSIFYLILFKILENIYHFSLIFLILGLSVIKSLNIEKNHKIFWVGRHPLIKGLFEKTSGQVQMTQITNFQLNLYLVQNV